MKLPAAPEGKGGHYYNEAPGPERDSSLENDEIEEDGTFACDNFTISILEVDDSTISTTEVDPYYEEEIVDTSPAEEDESQTQPQSPQIYAEKSVDLATNDANNDVEYATQKFIQQFLTGIHSCGVQSHRESLIAHIEAEGPENHHRLDRLVAHDIPHTLDKEYILAAETGDKITELSPDQWRALFTGSTTQGSDNKPKQACLHVEQAPQTHLVFHSMSIASWGLWILRQLQLMEFGFIPLPSMVKISPPTST
ncbi:hypothetical protein H9Q72_011901 [Fusarium xylarioides]|uniref:Uncharacterized protein n=1 Tax=Fusarium xylarioides TaxID=221167 RepID=A0A9P7KWM9_9HYPO|nr:hypothetical protein H9Q72_011901 [Fusarium xylarioides]